MLKTVASPLTVADYLELPQGPPYCQLIEGDLFVAPSPNSYHQDILGNLYLALRLYLLEAKTGTVRLTPSDVQLSDLNVYQPDLYYVSKARRSVLTEQGASGAPDLVVEILSPKTAKLDRGIKRSVYARTGVEELWIVDPDKKRVEIYRLGESADAPVASYGVRQKFESALFPGLKISVAKVFQR
jgi:Uma2 family endonuclease